MVCQQILSPLVRRDPAGSPWFLAAAATRATLLDPGRPSRASPTTALSVLGSGIPKPRTAHLTFPCKTLANACFYRVPPTFENWRSRHVAAVFYHELRKPEATPACGPRFCPVYASRKSFGAVIPGDSGSCPGRRQHSGLGGWLDLSI